MTYGVAARYKSLSRQFGRNFSCICVRKEIRLFRDISELYLSTAMSVSVANNLAAPSEGSGRRPASYYSATFVESKCE